LPTRVTNGCLRLPARAMTNSDLDHANYWED